MANSLFNFSVICQNIGKHFFLMKVRKTIFPKYYFGAKEPSPTADDLIGKELSFWSSISKKQKISDKLTYFLIFDLPNNTSIYEWFVNDATLKSVKEFVAYQTQTTVDKLQLFFDSKEVNDPNLTLDQIIKDNQSFRRRYSFTVHFIT